MLAALLFALAPQDFNVDVGSRLPPPSSAYGAASGRAGFWNEIVDGAPLALLDLAGNATPVSVTAVGGNLAWWYNSSSTGGEEGLLLDDHSDGDLTLHFTGLLDGDYEVHTYAWAPDNPAALVTDVTIAGDTQTVGGGIFRSAFALGDVHARHRVTVTGGALDVDVRKRLGAATCNGLQLARVDGACASYATRYCSPGTTGGGCKGRITAAGAASATSPDGFPLRTMLAEGGRFGVHLLGTSGRQMVPWGTSSSFQCVVPPVRYVAFQRSTGYKGVCGGRFTVDLNEWWTTFPALNPGPGALVQAQVWFRDPTSTSSETTAFTDAIEFTVCP